jgi:hypothetical protein
MLKCFICLFVRRWDASALTQRGHPLDVLISVAL